MDSRGKTHPLIPYNLIIDTDVGLYLLIKERYRSEKVFATGILDADPDTMRYFLVHREQVNPLETIAFDNSEENKKVLAEYYEQFFERELDFIVKHSSTTSLYNFVAMICGDKDVDINIWCPNKDVETFFKLGNPNVFNHVKFKISDTFEESIGEVDNPVYVKDIKHAAINYKYYYGKTIYLANYDFNYSYNKLINKKGIDVNAGIIFDHRAHITLYDPYNKNELKEIIGGSTNVS